MCLVGVPHVDRQPRHAVRARPARGRRAGLSQREKSLKPQRPLQGLGTHSHRLQAAAAQLAGGERQGGGQGVDVDRVPRHQRPHGFAYQRIHVRRTSELSQEAGLQARERPLGCLGLSHRLHEVVCRTPPQLRQAQALVYQVVEHRRQGRRGPRVKPHAHDGGVRRDDLDLRTGQRTDQLGTAADRKVDLDPARRQVSLHVRRRTDALDPDRPHHARQPRQRRTLNVRAHCGHPGTEASALSTEHRSRCPWRELRTAYCVGRWLRELVLPSLAPGEVCMSKVFQCRLVDVVIQAPAGGHVPDHEDPLAVPAQGQVG